MQSGEICFLNEINHSRTAKIVLPSEYLAKMLPLESQSAMSATSKIGDGNDGGDRRDKGDRGDRGDNVCKIAGRGDYVRVTGHLSFIDTARRYCQILDGDSNLLIDLRIADMPPLLMPGCCCQFIGELRDMKEQVIATLSLLKSNYIY